MLQRHKEATSVVNHRSLFWHLQNFSSRKTSKNGVNGGGAIPISILQTHSFPLKYINSSTLSPWQAPLISRQTKKISDMDLLLLLIVLPTQPDLFLGRVAHSIDSKPAQYSIES